MHNNNQVQAALSVFKDTMDQGIKGGLYNNAQEVLVAVNAYNTLAGAVAQAAMPPTGLGQIQGPGNGIQTAQVRAIPERPDFDKRQSTDGSSGT